MDKSKINMHKRMAMGMKPKKMAMGAMALGALGAMAAKKMMGKKSGSTDKMKSGMGGALAGLAMKKKKELAMGKMGGMKKADGIMLIIEKKAAGGITGKTTFGELSKRKPLKKGIRLKGKGSSFMKEYKKRVYNRAGG